MDSLQEEKRELSTQLQHQLDVSRRRMSELEGQHEESERTHEAALEERRREWEDLRMQLDNSDRQLKASKAFVQVCQLRKCFV